MAQVLRLGGADCTYYNRGRCTRTKDLGSSSAARCKVLEAHMRAGPSQGGAAASGADSVFLQKQAQKEAAAADCPDFAAKPGAVCRHEVLGHCLLLLPTCPGRCENFLRRRALDREP